MTTLSTPYDELPYQSFPIEWTAPERLALASLLHGGPRQRLDEYRVLELGCGDGANLIPMAYYRRHGEFVGIDSAHSQIEVANQKRSSLELTNLRFVATNFRDAVTRLSGQFDYIIGHGVFSWVSHDVRDGLLELCAERLRPGGLVYLNYNARPGWNVRGLIRDFLLIQTATITDLRARAERAREIAARMVRLLDGGSHPYSQLLANEFKFVGENPLSHTAHEYLADFNYAYARSEFLELVARNDFVYVADADFNYRSGRLPEGLGSRLAGLDLEADTIDLTADLVCYRQLHSPMLTQRGFERIMPDADELSRLTIASCLLEREPNNEEPSIFEHPSGYQVEAKTESIATVLRLLHPLWPRGLYLGDVVGDIGEVIDDLRLLHRNGLIELGLLGTNCNCDLKPLNRVELR